MIEIYSTVMIFFVRLVLINCFRMIRYSSTVKDTIQWVHNHAFQVELLLIAYATGWVSCPKRHGFDLTDSFGDHQVGCFFYVSTYEILHVLYYLFMLCLWIFFYLHSLLWICIPCHVYEIHKPPHDSPRGYFSSFSRFCSTLSHSPRKRQWLKPSYTLLPALT